MINKIWWFIHGKNATRLNYALIHGGSILFGLLYYWLFIPYQYFSGWQTLIFIGVFWEIFGGTIANFTASAKNYWHQQNIGFKEFYLSIHFFQPALFYLVFGWDLITCILLLTITLGLARFFITLPKRVNNILVIASNFLLIYGLVYFEGYELETLVLGFGYITKVILGFSLKWY